MNFNGKMIYAFREDQFFQGVVTLGTVRYMTFDRSKDAVRHVNFMPVFLPKIHRVLGRF